MIMIDTPCSALSSAIRRLLPEIAARRADQRADADARSGNGAVHHGTDGTGPAAASLRSTAMGSRSVPCLWLWARSGVARVGVTLRDQNSRNPGFDDLGFDQVVGEVPLSQVRRGETQGAC